MRTMMAVLVTVAFLSTPALAADPAVKCESGKLKEAGKYAACRLKADSKGVKKGESPDYSKCESKFATKWGKVEEKGEGLCPSEADELWLTRMVDRCDQSIATALAGGEQIPDPITSWSDVQTLLGREAAAIEDLGQCEDQIAWMNNYPTYYCFAGYDLDDGCDCGCGAIDPDCPGPSSSVCDTVWCPGAVDSSNNSRCDGVPSAWTCAQKYYGAGDGCDCGCGAVDPDCDDATAGSCLYCNNPGSCGWAWDCPGNIDATNNGTCSP